MTDIVAVGNKYDDDDDDEHMWAQSALVAGEKTDRQTDIFTTTKIALCITSRGKNDPYISFTLTVNAKLLPFSKAMFYIHFAVFEVT